MEESEIGFGINTLNIDENNFIFNVPCVIKYPSNYIPSTIILSVEAATGLKFVLCHLILGELMEHSHKSVGTALFELYGRCMSMPLVRLNIQGKYFRMNVNFYLFFNFILFLQGIWN